MLLRQVKYGMSCIWELSVEEWIDLCRSGNDVAAKVTLAGNSMRPWIRKDLDSITVIPLNRPLYRGDIVLFIRYDGAYTVHRVFRISEKHIQTLGDACLCPDLPVPYESILGLVTVVERNSHRYYVDNGWCRLFGRLWMNLLPARKLLSNILRKTVRNGKAISKSKKSS